MSTNTSEPLTQFDYQVGWICALPVEAAAATALLVEEHPSLDQDSDDTNAYTLGRMGLHNVVIGCLPLGSVGESSATAVAKDMLRSFPNIKIGLMVGVGGGAPGPPSEKAEEDIRLGDIVVSKPGPHHGGVIQYDFGKTLSDGRFVDIGYLNRPPNVLLTALTKLLSRIELEGSSVSRQVAEIRGKYPRKSQDWQYQGVANDQLYVEGFRHADIDRSCQDIHCARFEDRLVSRRPRDSTDPVIHCGLIASGNQVMRDSVTREKLRKAHGVLCFEMEAAGLSNHFPCLVIRGICDYSDSHKSKRWQPYAAAVSAAFAKQLLEVIPVTQVGRAQRAADIIGKLDKEFQKLNDNMKPLLQTQQQEDRRRALDWLAPDYYQSQHADIQRHLDHDSGKTFTDHEGFTAWAQASEDVTTLFCPGLPGAGKTSVASMAIERLQKAREEQRSAVAFLYFNYNLQSEQTVIHMYRIMLRQLVENLPSLPHEVTQLHRAGRVPSLLEMSDILSRVIEQYNLVFIVIDALDECSPESLSQIIDAVHRLQGLGARFMLTSRFNTFIEDRFRATGTCFLEIIAADREMETYIARNFDFAMFYKIPDESPEIDRFKQVVIRAAKGVFLLVRLFLNLVKNKCTRGEIQDELENIEKHRSKNPHRETYEKTLDMIARSGRREWAHRVLSWVFHARRPLGAKELQEALAAQSQRDMNRLDMNYAPPDIKSVISYCSGLVVLSPMSGKIEFVHFTAYQYFEDCQHEIPWISQSPKEISLACLKYLVFDPFTAKSEHTAFLGYTIQFWAEHTRQVQTDQEVRKTAKLFLQNIWLTGCVDRIFPADDHTYLSLSLLIDDLESSRATGLHLVARFGLVTLLEDLLEESPGPEINSRDPYGQTPLILAVRHGHQDVVDILLHCSDADPNLVDDDGLSPLSIASELGNSGIVQSLLSTRNVDPNLAGLDGLSPIMYAARAGHCEVMNLLLAEGRADPNFTTPKSQTALKLAVANGSVDVLRLLLENTRVGSDLDRRASNDMFMAALESGNKDVMNVLLQSAHAIATEPLEMPALQTVANRLGLSLIDYDERNERILWLAVQKDLIDVVVLLLRNKLVDPDLTGYGSRTVLMAAVHFRHKEIVEALLYIGSASVNAIADNGDTALFVAVVQGDIGIARILLDVGKADPNLGCQDPFKYPLPYAVEKNDKDAVQMLLETGNADPNPGLQAAISNSHLAMIRMFLSLPDVDPNVQDWKNGQTALMTAIRELDFDLVRFVLQNRLVDVNVQNWLGQTALMRAVTMHDLETAKLLVEYHGADTSIRCKYGETALDWAERYNWGNDEVAKLLSPKRCRTA
ncbi:ankyrin repeat-containing domain protein [Aspergillus unguis]